MPKSADLPCSRTFIHSFQGAFMNHVFPAINHFLRSFAKEEDGAQVVEYALIIAVVSIALVIALQALGGGSFNTFIGRVTNCLTTATCV